MNEGMFISGIHSFGNHVDIIGWRSSREILTAVPGFQILDDDFNLVLEPSNPFDVLINRKRRSFSLGTGDFAAAKVSASTLTSPVHLLRLLLGVAREDFFLPENELLEIVDRCDAELRMFMRLDEWHHPDQVEGELPSELTCFESLAEAIANDDPGRYVCPREAMNTHWSFWDDLSSDEEDEDLPDDEE